jgi:cell division protein FtsX
LSTSALIGTNIVVLIVGVVIGSVGSAIAIRRFLDV